MLDDTIDSVLSIPVEIQGYLFLIVVSLAVVSFFVAFCILFALCGAGVMLTVLLITP